MKCMKCGTEFESASTCPRCGEVAFTQHQTQPYQPPQPQTALDQPVQPYQAPQVVYQQAPAPGTAFPVASYQGSFAERIHHFGRSSLFLAGIILFTIGIVLNAISTLEPLTIIGSLAFNSLIIVALFIIYSACKSPKIPEKTLTALTLIKVYIIITLVILGLALLVLFGAGVMFLFIPGSNSYFGSSDKIALVAIGIFIIVCAVGLALFSIFYYRSILQIVASIKKNMLENTLIPLKGVGVFTVLTYIMIAVTLVLSFFLTLLVAAMGSLPLGLPTDQTALLEGILGGSVISFLISLTQYIGVIICVVVVNKLNKSLSFQGVR